MNIFHRSEDLVLYTSQLIGLQKLMILRIRKSTLDPYTSWPTLTFRGGIFDSHLKIHRRYETWNWTMWNGFDDIPNLEKLHWKIFIIRGYQSRPVSESVRLVAIACAESWKWWRTLSVEVKIHTILKIITTYADMRARRGGLGGRSLHKGRIRKMAFKSAASCCARKRMALISVTKVKKYV